VLLKCEGGGGGVGLGWGRGFFLLLFFLGGHESS